jgi:hypothetical protein
LVGSGLNRYPTQGSGTGQFEKQNPDPDPIGTANSQHVGGACVELYIMNAFNLVKLKILLFFLRLYVSCIHLGKQKPKICVVYFRSMEVRIKGLMAKN